MVSSNLTPDWFGFVVRFCVDPPLHAIGIEMAPRGGSLMFGKHILVTIKLLLSVAYLYNAMERGVSGIVTQFGIVGVRYDFL